MKTVLPMKTAGTQFLIERTNRESGAYQWARETLVNALEAGATRVEFGIEWQGVKSQQTYRRTIMDNGRGMSPEQLVAFFNTFGGGAKRIGGVHENFGVGAKTSLLPWNRLGVVVISWQRGIPAMIWMMRDPDTGEYGLRVMPAKARGHNVLENVFAPFEDREHGIDWRKVKPPWLGEHGTVIVLLGKDLKQDTVKGDPYRAEGEIKGVSSYLNHRMWDIASTGAKVYVEELRTQDKRQWPKAHATTGEQRTNLREIHGAKHWITYKEHKVGKLAAHGTVDHPESALDWYLWEGERPAAHSYAPMSGFIAVLYKNELYDFTNHHATYRAFGITERSVRQDVWIIARPPGIDPTQGGVYPRTDRNALLYKPKGVGNASRPIPLLDWAAWFADHMPEEIQQAIAKARGATSITLDDEAWRKRLAERFGARWRIEKLRPAVSGSLVGVGSTGPSAVSGDGVSATAGDLDPQGRDAPVIETGRQGPIGVPGGVERMDHGKLAGGIPHARWVQGDEFNEGMLAAWSPHDPEFPEGVVLLNYEHPVIRSQIKWWQDMYPAHRAEDVEQELLLVYGQVAVAKVAHSEHMKGVIPSQIVESDLRSEVALTMALLGLIAEESLLSRRLDAKFQMRSKRADHP